MGIYFAWIRLLRRLVMNIFGLGKKRLSFKASAASLPTVLEVKECRANRYRITSGF